MAGRQGAASGVAAALRADLQDASTAMTGRPDEDEERTIALRRFFLCPSERYCLADLARIWRVPPDQVVAMFFDQLGEEDRNGSDPLAFEVEAVDALNAANAFHVFRPVEVEGALGDEFERARPEHWRTIPLTLHVPRFVVEAVAGFPFLPEPTSLAARTERMLCEFVEADRVLSALSQRDSRRDV
jgi:hypothetical protein